MAKLFELIGKNLKLLFRTKENTFILLGGPILLVLLLGMAFNSAQLYGLKIASFSENYNTLSNSILDRLEDKFVVIRSESEDKCIEGVKTGDWHLCVVFSGNLDIENNNKLVFHIDPVQTNLVYIIKNIITEEISEKEKEISLELIEKVLQVVKNIDERVESAGQISDGLLERISIIKTQMDGLKADMVLMDAGFNTADSDAVEISYLFDSIEDETDVLENLAGNMSGGEDVQSSFSKIEGYLKEAGENIVNLRDRINSTKTQLGIISSGEAQTLVNNLGEALSEITQLGENIDYIRNEINSVAISEASRIVSPIDMETKEVTSGKYINYIFPTLLVLVLLFSGVLLSSSLIIMEKKSRAYFRNFILPVKRTLFFVSNYLTNLIVLFTEALVIVAIISFFVRIPFSPSLLLVVFLASSVFIFLGMIIGYSVESHEFAMLLSMALCILLLFFSNLILPIETIAYLSEIAFFNPFTISADLMKRIILLNLKFGEIYKHIIILGYYFVGLLAVLLIMPKGRGR